MAVEVRRFSVTTPSGTTQANPLVTDTSFPPRRVERITWRVPPGPRGTMGFRITMGGLVVIPVNGGWIVADDERDDLELVNQPTSGAWQVTSYNGGQFAHTIFVSYYVALTGDGPTTASVTPGVELAGTTVT
jgi:hypothetical protein